MKREKLSPLFWGSLILAVSQAFALSVAFREKDFVAANQINLPQVSIGLPLAYFFGAVLILGLVLFLVPLSKLRIGLKILFAFLFAWGIFTVLVLFLPVYIVSPIAIAGGLAWLFWPRIWFHNLLLTFALVGVGLVFGFLLSPWTAIALMLVISVYDVLAVHFGYMMWMAKKFSESEALPVFTIPRGITKWNINLKEAGFRSLFEDRTAEREVSILGGGDIGFPLLLAVSAFFAYGFASSVIVAAFSVLGLAGAYLIQLFFLKGGAMPALPPITFASLIGLSIVHFL